MAKQTTKAVIQMFGDGTEPEPKFLFVNERGNWATVVGIQSILIGGTPIVPDEMECDDRGEDATYVGRVADDVPDGTVDLSEHTLPPRARAAVKSIWNDRVPSDDAE